MGKPVYSFVQVDTFPHSNDLLRMHWEPNHQALQRSGALLLEGTERVTIEGCLMERNDGNAIMVSGYNRNASIVANEIRWTGDTAIASWGKTDEMSEGGIHGGDGTKGEHPDNTLIKSNLIHELGAFEKQSSMFFQAKTCRSVIDGNGECESESESERV